MSHNKPKRRLAAILAADVVGYTKRMAADEAATLAALHELRTAIADPAIGRFGGHVFNTAGDGLIAEFPSAVDAMQCAMEIQTQLTAEGHALSLRIGISVGDVVAESGDVFGDGVNLAARIQPLADPGAVAIEDTVRGYVQGKITTDFRDGGLQSLKNVDGNVRIWHWRPEAAGQFEPVAAPPLPEKPSIAVLPFDNMSGARDQDFLADGFVEAITAALSRIKSFFVIARNSAYVFKGRHENVRRIGAELGVAYVLEGSVQRAGNRIRVTVQLIDTAQGNHLWSETYDGEIEDIFDLQDTITEQVAGALRPSIHLAEIERARRKRPQDLGAYDFTMRAMRHVWRLEREPADRALTLLDKALAIEPDYTLALALAAWGHAQQFVYNWTDDPKRSIETALSLAQRAESFGHDDPLTLTVLGTVHTLAFENDTARDLLNRAVSIDPNSAWAWTRLGWLDAYEGRADGAEASFLRGLRLSPLDPLNFATHAGRGVARAITGDYAGALPYVMRALRERPGANWLRRLGAVCLVGAGRKAEAQEMAAELMRRQPDFTISRYISSISMTGEVKARFAALMRQLDIPEE